MSNEIKKFTKEWFKENPDYNRKKRREFIERNPDYDKTKIECECGFKYSRSNASHHRKTFYHISFLEKKLRNELEDK